MKNHIILAAAFAVVTSCTPASAQTFTAASGYAATAIFNSTPGFGITAFATDTNGDAYFIETDNSFMAASVLMKRTAASNYQSATILRTFGVGDYGNFIEVSGSRLFCGVDDSVVSVNTDGSGFDLLGSVHFNYDGVFSGGSLFLSASVEGFGRNKVYEFGLIADGLGGEMLDAGDVILDTDPDGVGLAEGDYSGPIEFDSSGALLYGANKSTIGGIYRYSAAEVAGAVGVSQLILQPPTNRIFSNGQNQWFARRDDENVLQTFSPFGGAPVANLFNIGSMTSEAVGQGDSGNGDYFSGAGASDDAFFVALTGGAGSTTVFQVVPEPVSGLLLALGFAALGLRRGRRS